MSAQHELHSLYGFNSRVNGSVLYVDENTIIYPCGHGVVLLNMETKAQHIFSSSEETSDITALSLSPNKRFLAVAESTEFATVSIYDIEKKRKRRELSLPDSETVVSMCFSPDGKQLLTQGGPPKWTAVLWVWDKMKPLMSTSTNSETFKTIYNVSFQPEDNSVICCSGNGVLKFFRIVDNSFKPLANGLKKRDPQNFLAHAFVGQNKLVASTDSGNIVLFEDYEWTIVLPSSPSDGNSIDSIIPFSKGFLCGCNEGLLRVYERSDEENEYFKCNTIFRILDNPRRIQSMAMSSTEEKLICSTDHNQLYFLRLSNADIMSVEDMHSEGNSTVTGLDTCLRKPLLASSSSDGQIRIWNYEDSTIEVMKRFDDTPMCLAFHPSGLQVAVGFNDTLCLMSILMDDIKIVHEFNVAGCSCISFSHGGHMFAASHSNIIQLFNTKNGSMLHTLRGHKDKVQAILWSPDDRKVTTACQDGSIIQWLVRTGVKDSDYLNDKYNWTDLQQVRTGGKVPGDGRRFLAVGVLQDSEIPSTNLVTVESLPELVRETCVVQSGQQHVRTLQICNREKSVYVGTADRLRPGVVRSYTFPFKPNSIIKTNATHPLSKKERDVLPPLSRDVLVAKSVVDDINSSVVELNRKVSQLHIYNEYQLRLRDSRYSEKMDGVSRKLQEELDVEKQKYQTLLLGDAESKDDHENSLQKLHKEHQDGMTEMDVSYKQKIGIEKERYETLKQEKEKREREWDEQNNFLVESHEKYVSEIKEDFEKRTLDERNLRQMLRNDREILINEFAVNEGLQEEDAQLEIQSLKTKYDVLLKDEREATLLLKGENVLMKKKFQSLRKDIDDQREEMNVLKGRETERFSQIKSLEKAIAGHKKEIKEREDTIHDKEQRVYDLNKKNQELEKFKFVLDYKVKELRRQIEPRMNEIADMKKQIKEMNVELKQYHKSNAALKLMIGELTLKLGGLQRETDSQKSIILNNESIKKAMRIALHDAHQYSSELKKRVASLYRIYEYNRQREYLEKSVQSLKKKLDKDATIHLSDHSRLTKENVILTGDINKLRRELKMAQIKVRAKNKRSEGNNKINITEEEAQRELSLQQMQLGQLAQRLNELEV
eukprot:GSMAST32.ASY1.ANO1.841.1 assembled CDS